MTAVYAVVWVFGWVSFVTLLAGSLFCALSALADWLSSHFRKRNVEFHDAAVTYLDFVWWEQELGTGHPRMSDGSPAGDRRNIDGSEDAA